MSEDGARSTEHTEWLAAQRSETWLLRLHALGILAQGLGATKPRSHRPGNRLPCSTQSHHKACLSLRQ